MSRLVIYLFVSTLLLGSTVFAEALKSTIVVNQAGYHPDWPKRAIFINRGSDHVIALINADNGDLVKVLSDPASVTGPEQSRIQLLDFSDVKIRGRFYLESDDLKSVTFEIGDDSYKEATRLLMRSYYLQRCGQALFDSETGLSHLACHVGDGVYPRDDEINKQGSFRDAEGGWHDAGDYGKYLAPATVTVNRLMSLYQMAPTRYPDDALGIPESGNGRSDLLDELIVELDWMLKMQRKDGAVYRKLSGKKWPSVVTPDEDTQVRYVYGVSSPETGKFIASMAMAARIYQKIDKTRAKRYLDAAIKSWAWLKLQPEQTIDWKQEDDKGSGSYLSSDTDIEVQLDTDRDDRLTAAIELFLATQDNEYQEYILAFAPSENYSLYEWKDASSLSLWNLMTLDHTPALADTRLSIQRKLMARADELYEQVLHSPFNVANKKIIWGSNKMTAEEGITLAHAWRLSGDKKYLMAAVDQLDYVFGRNPFNQSFVTGVGENAVKKPVHLFGRSVKRTIPGLLVGGPNIFAQDGIAPKDKGLMSYIDHERAYSVNEYAIDYNASLIGLLEVLAIYQNALEQTPTASSVKGAQPDTNGAAKDEDTQHLVQVPKKVLFMGNSFTYFNNSLHYHVEKLRRHALKPEAFAEYNFRAATIAGGYWFEHQASLNSLTENKAWDVVVLQGHSREAIDEDKRLTFQASLAQSIALLKKRGAKPMLFMTWAYKHSPEMITELEQQYTDIANDLNVVLVPVGSAFDRSLDARPDILLHAQDGIHPSREGTYLAACVFYTVLYGQSPEGLHYKMGLSEKAATFLQQVAYRTVATFWNQHPLQMQLTKRKQTDLH